MKKRPKKSTLNNALDRMASLQARARANGKCERCGAPATQVHHVLSRRFRRIRWTPTNLVASCMACHMYAHDQPIAFLEWFKSARTQDYVFLMDPEHTKPIHRSVADLEDLRDEMKAA